MPNAPKTTARTVRIADELWQAAIETAQQRGETVSDVVRRGLAAYVRRHRDSEGGGGR